MMPNTADDAVTRAVKWAKGQGWTRSAPRPDRLPAGLVIDPDAPGDPGVDALRRWRLARMLTARTRRGLMATRATGWRLTVPRPRERTAPPARRSSRAGPEGDDDGPAGESPCSEGGSR